MSQVIALQHAGASATGATLGKGQACCRARASEYQRGCGPIYKHRRSRMHLIAAFRTRMGECQPINRSVCEQPAQAQAHRRMSAYSAVVAPVCSKPRQPPCGFSSEFVLFPSSAALESRLYCLTKILLDPRDHLGVPYINGPDTRSRCCIPRRTRKVRGELVLTGTLIQFA